MQRHSKPGRRAVPSKAEPGTIFSMTMVPLALRKASPTFSVGVLLRTVVVSIEGIVKGSNPLTEEGVGCIDVDNKVVDVGCGCCCCCVGGSTLLL